MSDETTNSIDDLLREVEQNVMFSDLNCNTVCKIDLFHNDEQANKLRDYVYSTRDNFFQDDALLEVQKDLFKERFVNEDYFTISRVYFGVPFELPIVVKSAFRDELYRQAVLQDILKESSFMNSNLRHLYFSLLDSYNSDDHFFAHDNLLNDIVISAEKDNCLDNLERDALNISDIELCNEITSRKNIMYYENLVIDNMKKQDFSSLYKHYTDFFTSKKNEAEFKHHFSPKVMSFVKSRLLNLVSDCAQFRQLSDFALEKDESYGRKVLEKYASMYVRQ